MFLHEIIKGADPAHLVFEGDAVVTYGELEKTVARYRNTLYEMGVRQGERVGLYTANRAEFVYVFMAVVSLGAIIIPINNSLVDREVCWKFPARPSASMTWTTRQRRKSHRLPRISRKMLPKMTSARWFIRPARQEARRVLC